MTDRLGQVLDGKYTLVKLLGIGGMGEVYEAEHAVIDRTVAVKLLRAEHVADSIAASRFLREAKSASTVKHRNVVEIHDVGTTGDGVAYIVMELLEGRSLAELIEAEAPLPPSRAIAIAVELLEGLSAAHAKGIIHRDLKPHNVFITTPAGSDQEAVKIVDFGISKVLDKGDRDGGDGADRRDGGDGGDANALTSKGASIGTPNYMAPEQIQDSAAVDEGADLWAVGAILFEMLTGAPPFIASSPSEVLARVMVDPAPDLGQKPYDLPAELAVVIDKALSKSRAGRHASALELKEELERCRSALPADDAAPPEPFDRTVPDRATTSADRGSDSSPFAPTRGDSKARSEPPKGASALKRFLWYLAVSPIIAAPLLSSLSRPRWIDVALGLGDGLPAAATWSIAALLSAGALAASIAIEDLWRLGRRRPMFHGRLFVVFPAAGLVLALWHFLTLRGQTASYWLTLRSYMEIDGAQGRELSELIGRSSERFLEATTLDQIGVAALACMVLLGTLFVRFVRREEDRGRRAMRRWLLLPTGLAVIAVVHGVLLADVLSFMGIFVFALYGVWVLTTVATLRLSAGEAEAGVTSGDAIAAGVVAAVAVTGSQIALGYVSLLQTLLPSSALDLPPGDREWIFESQINPAMHRGLVAEWCLLALLFAATFLVSRRGHRGDERSHSGSQTILSRALIVFITCLPLALALLVAAGAGSQWSTLKVSTMEPVSVPAGGPRSLYVDREPQALYSGRRGLLAGLTGRERTLRGETVGPLIEELAGRGECDRVVASALEGGGRAEPARCVTAIEARLYCEGLGKRLPTPEEWDDAVGRAPVVDLMAGGHRRTPRQDIVRGPFAEWTMLVVHGTPTFEVRGVDAIPEGETSPSGLQPDSYSPQVGFRCVWGQGQVTPP